MHLLHIDIIIPELLAQPTLLPRLVLSDPLTATYRFVKLASYMHINLFVLFYAMWHCAANFMGELSRYADRTRFYGKFLSCVVS